MIKKFLPFVAATAVFLAGCAADRRELVSTATLSVITEGRETAVYSLTDGAEYHFKTVRVRKGQHRPHKNVATDTPAVRITLEGNTIVINDKTAHTIYRIT